MTAYNRDWLDALAVKNTAREWHSKGLLSDEKWQAIQEANPSNFYTPNVFVRIGLAIFALILVVAVMGLAAMVTEPDSDSGLAAFGFVWGIIWIAVLEIWAIRTARHHGSGIDDVLLYTGVYCVVASWCSQLPNGADTLAYCFVAWPFLLAGSIRYCDRLMALATFLCTLLIVLLTVNKIPGAALYLLPFTGMGVSAAVFFAVRKAQRQHRWRHWNGSLAVLELAALLTFYASGNYWVVQQVAQAKYALDQPPMGWFFWGFTMLVPLALIWQGIVRKDRLLLDGGLAIVAAAVFTFRIYFHVVPWAWAALIAGAGLFLIAYFSIRYLQKNAGAYTYDADGQKSMLQKVEEQLIEQTISVQTAPNPVKGEPMGGGQFGGGGAGSDF